MLKALGIPVVVGLLILISLATVFGIVKFGISFGIGVIVFSIGLPVLVYSAVNVKFGVITFLVIAFFLLGVYRFVKVFQLGLIFDTFLMFMLISLIFKKPPLGKYKLASNPVSWAVWIWIGYNVLEFFNPIAATEAWFFVIRTVASWFIFYFVVLNAADDFKFFKQVIHVWIILATIGGLYGLFQEYHGMLDMELDWINSDELRRKLYFNWGRYRIFSFFNDPTVFGILMSFSALFCITLLTGPYKLMYKLMMAFAAIVMLLAMVHSGTRTAFAMLPAGFFFYAALTFQKKTLAFAAAAGLIGAFVIFSDIQSLPFLSTNSLERIRSTFKPDDDPSFQLREQRQATIKPYIQSHPFGAGLGSIGMWGNRFNSGSAIGGFAPDSGYVRTAVEMGWVGLLFYCGYLCTVIIVGIKSYYCIQNKELKAYVAALIGASYSLVVGNYPQQALILAPTVFVFYAIMALLVNSKMIDKKLTTAEAETPA